MELLDEGRPSERRHDGGDRHRSSRVLAAAPEPSGCTALLDPPLGTDEDARTSGEGSRSAAASHARCGARRPHAGPHLPARRPVRRRGQGEPASGRRRRGLHHAVPVAGDLSARLLPAQHPLHLDGRDDVRAERAGDRGSTEGRVGDPAPRRWPRPRRSRVFWSCPTTRSSASESGTRSLPSRLPPTIRSSSRGVWHFARGRALPARAGSTTPTSELAALRQIVADPALATLARVGFAEHAGRDPPHRAGRSRRATSPRGARTSTAPCCMLDRAVRHRGRARLHGAA